MTSFPDTRHSLLVRLGDHDDERAWAEFAELYRPVFHQLARRKGLQHADAEELAQEALLAVSRAVERWRRTPDRGPFRAWLARIAKNLAVNMLTRTRPGDVGVGGSDFHRLLSESPEPGGESRAAELEYRRAVFCWAAERVRCEFRETTWRIFWETCVEGHDIAAVCSELGVSLGAAYVARSRVASRLREKVRRFGASDQEPGR